MTIDEAIEFSKYKAKQQYDELQEYEYDAEEHEQLAEWLEELKVLREETQIQDEGLTGAYLLGKYDGIKQGRADERKKIMDIVYSAEDNAHAMFLLGQYFMIEQLKEKKK